MTVRNFALLIIGNLGTSGQISLKTLTEIKPNRICIFTDEAGSRWLNTTITKLNINKSNFCKHNLSQSYIRKLNIKNLNHHRIFGKEDFVRITPLKWLLILSVFEKHKKLKHVIFSDLDVAWFNLDASFLKYTNVLAQNDPRPANLRAHYCTGIMIWPNNKKTKEILKKILNFQIRKLLNGDLLPDEPAFNVFAYQNEDIFQVSPLPDNKFIIGYRAADFLTSNKCLFSKVNAFHANYVAGDLQKKIILKSIISKKENSAYWIYGIFMIFAFKYYKRTIILMNTLTPKMWSKVK